MDSYESQLSPVNYFCRFYKDGESRFKIKQKTSEPLIFSHISAWKRISKLICICSSLFSGHPRFAVFPNYTLSSGCFPFELKKPRGGRLFLPSLFSVSPPSFMLKVNVSLNEIIRLNLLGQFLLKMVLAEWKSCIDFFFFFRKSYLKINSNVNFLTFFEYYIYFYKQFRIFPQILSKFKNNERLNMKIKVSLIWNS